MYLSYLEYQNMGGTLGELDFIKYESKCRHILDKYTAQRVSKMAAVPQAVKYCMFDLIKYEVSYDTNVSAISSAGTDASPFMLKSFSTDGYSESYALNADNSADYLKQFRSSTDTLESLSIKNWLSYEYDDRGVLLLYRGVV